MPSMMQSLAPTADQGRQAGMIAGCAVYQHPLLHQQHTAQAKAKSSDHINTSQATLLSHHHHDPPRSLRHLPLGLPRRSSLYHRLHRHPQLDLLHLPHRQRPHPRLLRPAQTMLQHHRPVHTLPAGPGLLWRQPLVLQHVEEYRLPDEL